MTILNRFTQFTLLSVLFHLFLGLIFAYVLKIIPSDMSESSTSKKFQIQKVSPELLKKLKTVGKKDGKKGIFTSPIKVKKANQSNQTALPLDLRSLSHKTIKKVPKNISKGMNSSKKVAQKSLKPKIKFKQLNNKSSQAFRLQKQQQVLQQQVLKEVSSSTAASELLQNKGFNVQFETPEGIEEDELNTVEKMLYGFQKRMFQTYVNSFLMNFNNQIADRPYIKEAINKDRHLLKGRVVFDKDGNIMSIKIFKSSQNDDVHKLFEDTLRGMKALPNPPQVMVKGKEKFTIYYTLQLN